MIKLLHGDCLELMKNIPDNSIDMVLTDPPYGTTACKWDTVIPLDPMWKELKRITKDNGAICLFGKNPFMSNLIMSNVKMYKYDWIWDRVNQISNYLNAKRQPQRVFENIAVFYKKQPLYDRQMREGTYKTRKTKIIAADTHGDISNFKPDSGNIISGLNPIDILSFKGAITNGCLHPTQKPVPLLEYLIKTYTLENETVLDFTMGSGSTGVAAKNLNRDFIGIEMDDKYFKIASERIND